MPSDTEEKRVRESEWERNWREKEIRAREKGREERSKKMQMTGWEIVE